MSNLFLKVDKDLFKSGLNPIEILVLSQITEFNINTGDCFISDKQLAEQFGVGDKTISRTLKNLEELGYITRETKNIKGGKERHIKINSTTDKMTVDKNSTTDKMSFVQQSNCPLHNGQIDLIKDNSLKDNIKDNKELLSQATKPLPEERLVEVTEAQIKQLWRPEDVIRLDNGIIQVGNKKFKIKGE